LADARKVERERVASGPSSTSSSARCGCACEDAARHQHGRVLYAPRIQQEDGVVSIREQSPEGLREAVEAVALIEITRVDFRDVSVALGVLAYACVRIGQSQRPFFEDASKRADPQVAEMLRELARQSFAGRKLSDWSRVCAFTSIRELNQDL
jgi:hypothetical protein